MAKKHHYTRKKQNTFINNMVFLSNKSQARNIAYYCAKAYPYLYSVMAIALHENYGWGEKRINNLINEIDSIWDDYADKGIEGQIFDDCLNRTGIALMDEEEARKRGLIDGNS